METGLKKRSYGNCVDLLNERQLSMDGAYNLLKSALLAHQLHPGLASRFAPPPLLCPQIDFNLCTHHTLSNTILLISWICIKIDILMLA